MGGGAIRISGMTKERVARAPPARTLAIPLPLATRRGWRFPKVFRTHSVRVAAERVRDRRNRPLRADAVPCVVEWWGDDGDTELTGRHRNDPAADPALAGQPR